MAPKNLEKSHTKPGAKTEQYKKRQEYLKCQKWKRPFPDIKFINSFAFSTFFLSKPACKTPHKPHSSLPDWHRAN